MSLPRKRKLDISIKSIDPQGGPKNWVDQFLSQNKQNLPREVDLTDLDAGFVEFVNKDLEIIVEGEKVPVTFLTLQRWNEFSRTWQNSDKYKNTKIPFISVVRRPNPEMGTNPADFKIPVRKNFPYAKVPVWDGNRKGVDVYGIPNPVGADMFYTVRFFTYKMRELNKVHKKVLQTFASAQAYVNIKGHYFPILLESIGDESQIDNLEGKRFYVQTYEMRLQGYIVDSEEFEVKPAVSRAFLTTEVGFKASKPIIRNLVDVDSDLVRYIIQFIPGSPLTELSFSPDCQTSFNTINTTNVLSYTLYLNGIPVTLPFTASENDTITVSIIKDGSFSEIEFIGLKEC